MGLAGDLRGNWALSHSSLFVVGRKGQTVPSLIKKSLGLWVNGPTLLKCILSLFLQVRATSDRTAC